MPAPLLGAVFSASGPGRFRVFLIVAALLFCHGAFGYAHQLPPVEVQAERTAHAGHAAHAAGVHGPVGDENAEGMDSGGAYFATLLLLLFGATLLVGGRVPAGPGLPVPRLRVDRGVRGLRPPRGPTIPRLQVFRL